MLRHIVLTLVLAAWASAAQDDPDQLKQYYTPKVLLDEFRLDGLPTDECNESNSDPFKEIKYYLYTRTEPVRYELSINDHGESFKRSSFNPLKATKFLIHSWLQDIECYDPFVYDYLMANNYNVIVMDWSAFSRRCNLNSTHNYVADKAAKSLGTMMKKLLAYGAYAKDFHLIGYSVGAHIAGNAAKMLIPNRVGRITALDPVGYEFNYPGKPKIQNADATFMDVIYTSQPFIGSGLEFGHLSFHPNGGLHPQAGIKGDRIVRSSLRSLDYFRESITRPEAFAARKCEDLAKYNFGLCHTNEMTHMGEYASETARGKFYLKTNSQKPYFAVPQPRATRMPHRE